MSFVWTVDNPLVTTDSNYTASGSYLPGIPNVPNWPGVPQLARALGAADAPASAATLEAALGVAGMLVFGARLYSAVALDVLSAGPLPQYAILDSSQNAALEPDSVIDLDAHVDSGIMTHPIEEGAFDSYNRVQDPIIIRLMLACSGTKAMSRALFLATLRALREGTDLVTLVTPEGVYRNMALRGFGYRKSAERGAVTIWAETTWMEGRSTGVKVSAPPTSQPFGSAVSNLGSVQLQALTPQQLAVVNNPPTTLVSLPSFDAGQAPPSGAAS